MKFQIIRFDLILQIRLVLIEINYYVDENITYYVCVCKFYVIKKLGVCSRRVTYDGKHSHSEWSLVKFALEFQYTLPWKNTDAFSNQMSRKHILIL